MTLIRSLFAFFAFPALAFAQMPLGSGLPEAPSPEDLDEVEDVVPDTEFLPEEHRQAPAPDVKAAERIARAQARELALSQYELRHHFSYRASLALGPTIPWQFYSTGLMVLSSESWAFGLSAGGGRLREQGIVEGNAYDLTYSSRSVALTSRYYVRRLAPLSLSTTVGYAAWEGNVKPRGADTSEPDDVDRITSSFQAHGPFVGMSVVLTWLWKNGFFLEWVPVGVSKSQTYKTDLTRESVVAGKAVESQLKQAGFYGLTNLTLGMWF